MRLTTTMPCPLCPVELEINATIDADMFGPGEEWVVQTGDVEFSEDARKHLETHAN